MFDIIGLYNESKEKLAESRDKHRTNIDVRNILINSEKLSEEDINKCITGLSAQGIYNINHTSEYLSSYEILIDCPDSIDKIDFLNRVYDQGDSFLIFQRVFGLLSEKLPNQENGSSKRVISQKAKIAVNTHPTNFIHPNFSSVLSQSYGGQTNLCNLTLEFLESEFNPGLIPTIHESIERYKGVYNFKVALDDFNGTTEMLSTYLSFSNVFDTIKIDKDYFRSIIIADFQKFSELIQAFQDSGKQIVVEGVKNTDHHNILNELGIDFGQGNYFGEKRKI